MELVRFDWAGRWDARARYALLDRVWRKCGDHAVGFRGFSLAREASFLLDGSCDAVAWVLRKVRLGNARDHGSGALLRARRYAVYDAFEALVELHGSHPDPLADPWSSHRDLMGFRKAWFFDSSAWARPDSQRLHVRLNAGPVPRKPGVPDLVPDDLRLCTRIAAAVLGRLPGHRSSYRLTVQMARAGGLRQKDVAEGLLLSPRYVRILERQPEPLLHRALCCLGDPRLRVVP